MAPATASVRNSAAAPDQPGEQGARDLVLRWSGRVPLTGRILAVNIIALLMLAGGFFYLDSYRSRLVDARTLQQAREAVLIAAALTAVPETQRPAVLLQLARDTRARVRTYDRDGRLTADTRALGLRNFGLRDPDRQTWRKDAARFLDAVIDTVVGAGRDPLYRERAGGAWPDVRAATRSRMSAATVWRAPDRTPVITAAAPLAGGGALMTTINARDITQTVRDERLRLAIVLATATLISVLLSLFLARTIVRPIRRLARAAVRVRLGRARGVEVPRLPSRRDELGMLARAVSDMSAALRERIDATEAFAADVTHELKNPLASLRSAVDGLAQVERPELRAQLLAIVRDDVQRLDRLITDISDASRLDAELSRAQFEVVDLTALIAGLLEQREARGVERGVRIEFSDDGRACIAGEGMRLERVFENLIDNAVSFSPADGTVAIRSDRRDGQVEITIADQGPGVPEDARETIFRRFHSVRPESEAFGKHSGLGLAIARTIVEAHQGTITALPARAGARFAVRLPLVEAPAA